MPVALTIEPVPVLTDWPARKRWTRTECDRFEALGGFDGQRYELIEGELINKMGKNQPHVLMLAALGEWFNRNFPGRVMTEAPVEVALEDAPINEPEPDLLLLHGRRTALGGQRPSPQDVALLIEVADSTRAFDTTVKAKLYARAGVLDYWVVDVKANRVVVFREPREGSYTSVIGYDATEMITPLSAPDQPFRLSDVPL